MSKAKVIAVAVAALTVVAIRWTDASATDVQGAVRSLEDSFAQAVRAKDVDAIMKHYTVSEDLVVFDVVPPRQYTGWKAYKEDWRKILSGCKDSPKFEISELVTYGGGRFAYSHSIQNFSCTNQQDKKLDMILRVTDGYANFGGEWLIAHEHVSVPVDLTTGQAILQSKP
ncbi:MAG: nuclear transport factor 2 family protein [Candidatus Binatus sp.]|jgi:ketosteroid isomerase-like protein|uniref:YybH family protein n=1 Tax=Candidatus Binatus sp. TaxID=2811406 RepID=UPI003C8B988D